MCHNGNWVDVLCKYSGEAPVTDATFVVQEPNNSEPSGRVISEVVLSAGSEAGYEFVHVDLGDYSGPVKVFFFFGPTEPVPFEVPAPVEDERDWLIGPTDGFMSTGRAEKATRWGMVETFASIERVRGMARDKFN